MISIDDTYENFKSLMEMAYNRGWDQSENDNCNGSNDVVDPSLYFDEWFDKHFRLVE